MSDDDFEPRDEDDRMHWEVEADEAVQSALSSTRMDEVRGSIVIPSEAHENFSTECNSYEEFVQHLEELYDGMWYANVPFDSGMAVYESDSWGAVGNAINGTEIEQFFVQVREPDGTDRIILARDLTLDVAASRLLAIEFTDVDKELVEYFAKHPEKLRDINPRAFEKLMAAIYKNRGFDVTLTRKSKDGGFDLMLLKRSDVGAAMTLVDCKRYNASNKVGVEVVRGLYGVVEAQKATGGMIVTTSTFTSGAKKFRDELKYRMGLTDLNDIRGLLRDWRK